MGSGVGSGVKGIFLAGGVFAVLNAGGPVFWFLAVVAAFAGFMFAGTHPVLGPVVHVGMTLLVLAMLVFAWVALFRGRWVTGLVMGVPIVFMAALTVPPMADSCNPTSSSSGVRQCDPLASSVYEWLEREWGNGGQSVRTLSQ